MSIFKPIKLLSDYIVYNLFSLSPHEKFAIAFNYFIDSSLKILFLIVIIGFIIGIIREFLTPQKVKNLLKGKKTGIGNIIAAIIGVIMPVESFSVVPVFLGFIESGIPAGIAFTFLVTAPMTNELAFAVLWGLYGPKIAALYYLSGIFAGIFIGLVITWLKLDKYVNYIGLEKGAPNHHYADSKNFKYVIINAKNNSIQFLKSFWIYVVFGIALAAIAREYFPTQYLLKIIGITNPFAVPLAVFLVLCFYINITAVLPIIMIFINNDLPMGTIIAFVMAVTATSIPEILILKKALKAPLLIIYLTLLLSIIIFIGYVVNFTVYSY